MSAKRPYRDAMPWEKIFEIMSSDAGQGVDPDCVRALARWHEHHELKSRVDDQLREVERLSERCNLRQRFSAVQAECRAANRLACLGGRNG